MEEIRKWVPKTKLPTSHSSSPFHLQLGLSARRDQARIHPTRRFLLSRARLRLASDHPNACEI